MALPILLIVATSVSQIYDNKCAKMNHGLMIHDYCLQKVLMRSFILQKLLRFVLPSLQQKYIYFKIFSCLLFFLHYVQRPTLIVILCKCS